MNEPLIEAHYRLSETDFLNSIRHRSWQSFRWLALATPLLLLVGIYDVVWQGKDYSTTLVVAVLMGAYLVLLFQVLLPRRVRRIFKESKSLQNDMHLRLYADRAEFESASGNYRLPWSDVHKWDEFSGLFAVYPSSAAVVLIPQAQVDRSAMTFAKTRLAEAGLPDRKKTRKA